jgi:hypothetical protein
MDARLPHLGPQPAVTRVLDLEARRVAAALTELRHETAGPLLAWTLGNHGRVEFDLRFEELVLGSVHASDVVQHLTTSAQLWSPDGSTQQSVALELVSFAAPPSEVTLRVVTSLADWFAADPRRFERLGTAALDELCEEVLYQAIASPCEGQAAA